nr:hypothetical protein REQ54_01058 [Rhizobium sp. Q54]
MSEEQAVLDLVKALGAVLHGCKHDSVMSALGTVTLLAIVDCAEDRDEAEAMAEEFAEVITEAVAEAMDGGLPSR